jgi:Putative tail fiber protein gp53-like, C-terminal
MEPRNYESGAAETPPTAPETPSLGYPIAGNPSTGTPATKPGPFWLYKVGESLRRVIVSEGLTPDDADLDLLNTAISAKVASKASQAELDAGANDTKFVTPQKLRGGFSVLLATNGYIVLPTWLGGLILQWGTTASIAGNGGNSGTINFLVPFPTTARYVGMIGNAPVTNGDNTNLSLSTKTNTSFSFVNSYLSAVAFDWIALGY